MKRRIGSRAYLVIGVVLVALIILIAALLFLDTEPGSGTAAVTLPSPTASAAVSSGQDREDDRTVLALVTPETVQAVVASLPQTGAYSRIFTVESFFSGGSSSSLIAVWVRGSGLRVKEVSESAIRNTLILDDQLWIWYDDSTRIFSGRLSDLSPAEVDRYQRLISYQQLLSLDADAILEADYTDYAGCPCIYARYRAGELGYDYRVYVSVDTGLLMGSETWDGDTLIYRMVSDEPDISTPEDEVFSIPQ